MCSFTAISGPAFGSRIRCGAAVADEPVAEVAAGVADRGDLRVLGERVVDLAVAGHDLPLARRAEVEQRLVGQLVHPGDQLAAGVGDDEVGAVSLERLDRRRGARPDAGRSSEPDVLAGQVGVLLGAGERELLLDDLLGEHEPGVVVAGGPDVAQRAEGVEAGEERRRQPLAGRVEPQRRRAGQDADAVPRPRSGPSCAMPSV